MDDKAGAGLAHVPSRLGLAVGAGGAGLAARGRRDGANAATNGDYRQGVAAYRAERFTEAAGWFLRAAERGHAESQYVLSTLLESGQGVARDAVAAALWERRAAEQGHGYAQGAVSFRHYAAGEFGEAFEWCQRAADGKLAWAQYHLGLMYGKGEGVARDDGEAAYWIRLAALQGFAAAEVKLAGVYSLGLGVERDAGQAAVWYGRAAAQGDAEAQFQLGQLYALGLGVECDYTAYREWTRQAAAQGHEGAAREMKRREYRDA